ASLGALDAIPGPDRLADAWAEPPPPGLVAALGIGAGGRTVAVDLVADGPHVLVAGTTGAGKSELLTTLVLSLALTHPPDRLAILLVDFKGGTGLGPVAGLPHVLEHVTDLDAAHARRILAALRAELRRRETLLAAAGVRDLLELDPADPGTPPRLLVVVDELRALTEDLPDSSAALTRIAAQGRALGIHLVLATQRPAGAVGADLRANVAVRVALRVTDPADSTDVLDAPDAALIDPATPGRAWLRRGSRSLEPVQIARAVMTTPAPVLRVARPWV
ncbi:FtsK/SpoIIIE domain-containing protein, partial [Cellulomonas sp. P5_C6]